LEREFWPCRSSQGLAHMPLQKEQSGGRLPLMKGRISLASFTLSSRSRCWLALV
jgi:hypothetical protein